MTEKVGFCICANNVLRNRSIPDGALRVYSVLCSYAGQTDICFPSEATIAETCGISVRQVQRNLKILERRELIERQREHVAKFRVQNVYRITDAVPRKHIENVHAVFKKRGTDAT